MEYTLGIGAVDQGVILRIKPLKLREEPLPPLLFQFLLQGDADGVRHSRELVDACYEGVDIEHGASADDDIVAPPPYVAGNL